MTRHLCLSHAIEPTRMEVGRFLRTIEQSRHPLAARDHALFATLAYTGIRLSDVIRLRVSDINPHYPQLLLRRTKGGRQESRCLPARLTPILSRYLNSCSTTGDEGGTLFVTRQGRPLSPRAAQYRFAFWLRRARILKALSIHSLRHTFGTLLYQATRDLLLVGRALGHRDVKNTQRYAHLNDHVLATAVNAMW